MVESDGPSSEYPRCRHRATLRTRGRLIYRRRALAKHNLGDLPMKRILAVFLLLTAGAVCSSAQTQADRDRAVQYLEKTRQGVLDATKGLSPEQWNFKPGPDRWSVAEVMEHIASAEDLLYGMIQEQAMKAPARPAGEDVKALDELVLTAIPDRTHKAQAPEPLKPTNRFGSPEAAIKHFEESRAK